VKAHIIRPYAAFRVAAHYGCHALRPSEITGFDDPVAPVLFDDLVATTGAESMDWPEKLACCGGPVYPVNETLSMTLAGKKLAAAGRAEAHAITTACPFCQLQFERFRRDDTGLGALENGVLSIVYPQLLGFAMGLDPDMLGIKAGHRQVLERFSGT
ncbi:MAG: heterodisulfide reductase, partial [Deltaproteobacteria bacterium]|nr:heterodisulfide reductase [Deltaproteobacteria bacterium]